MSLSEPQLNTYYIPVFLRRCDAYREYIIKAGKRELKLPPYTTNHAGQVTVYHGELFCRLPNCYHNHVPISTTRKLRQHLIRHGIQVATKPPGRLSTGQEDATIQWYKSLLEVENDNDDNIIDEGKVTDDKESEGNTVAH
ncbi:uncharacterized protein PGRI_040090 [Penicillium griseofulvum]|uniref:Uncharacterized protein n=1 Tax=Penicillium patulum TaxID=5078 RepID=A0A135L956_PENPA|nr:uncharacterized protein PGRI_040090 [Penicillium griseofulvum]KXG45460.1 hypothetical protein PGRI_040090 [Penicillium griseofulvum]